jgi:tetratricopeptide (TPR) repeat protein
MKKILLVSFLISFFAANIFADELSEGYKSFINNDIKQAYQHFTAAAGIPETKAEASLMLALISTVDKPETSFNYFMEFYKSSPDKDAYAYALFHHQCVLGYESLKSPAQVAWLKEMQQRTDLNSTLRANVLEELGKYYETILDLKTAREYFSKIGAIMEWQVVGDFENISASGFDKDYGPLSHPEPDAVFKNKIGADIKWFDLYKQVNGKWIDFTNNFYCKNTLVYVQTFCNSPADQTVMLRIGTSGSLKIWVNDQLLFKEEEERNNGMDTYMVPVKLNKGNNRILLQVASSKIDQCNFMMRVTDLKGGLLPDLSFSKTYQPYSHTTQDIPALQVSSTEEFLSKQVEEHPEKLVNYLVLANVFLSNDKIHDALNVLKKAQEIAPNCSYLMEQMLELYVRDQDRTSTSLVQEKLKLIDPDNPIVIGYLIQNDFSSQNYKEARKYIEKLENLYGISKNLYLYKLKLSSEENNAEEYTSLIDKAYTLYPNDYDIVYQKYSFEKDYKQNQKAAFKILKDFSKKYFNKNILENLSDDYIKAGQANDGIKVLNQIIEYLPFSDYYYKLAGSYYLQAGNFDAANKYFAECLKIAPYYGPYHGNVAKVFEGKGDTENAIKEYQLNILYQPDNYEIIRKLRTLESKKDVFSYFPEKDYYKIFDESPTAADYPTDNFISLTEERQVVLYENGGCEIRVILLLKALTLKGIDNLKEYTIGYSSSESLTIEKAEVLKKNGNRLQAEVKDNQIVYTSLEPGDAVFLIYKKSSDVTGQMSKEFAEKYLMNTWYTSLNIQYSLLVSKDIKFDYKLDNSDLKPQVSDADEFRLYTWDKTMNKAVRLESYMPSLLDVGELLNISTIPGWKYITDWYYDISNTKTKPDVEVIETVNTLLKGKENLTEYEKANIFYNYIEQNIRYSSVSFRQSGTVPQKASDVIITKIGDCKDLSVLFTSMCKAAGIKAEIVLVVRRDNGTNWKSTPSFNFDHAIAKAWLDGKEYYMELTSPYFPFATLNESLIKANVLDISKDSDNACLKTLNPSTRQANNLKRNTNITFDGDNMIYSISVLRTGSMTANTRANYRNQSKDDREKKFVQSITGDYANTKLLSLNFNSSLDNCSDTVTYNYSYMAPKVFNKINGLMLVKIPLTDHLSPFDFLLEERTYPIEAWKYTGADTIEENLVIVFPESKKLAEVPKSVHYSCNQGDYSLTFTTQGNELHVVRTMIYKNDYVPVSEYNDYRNFIESVVSADTQYIGFK